MVDRIEESIVEEEEEYGVLKAIGMVMLIFLILFIIWTVYNLSQGKTLPDSVPICKVWISRFYRPAPVANTVRGCDTKIGEIVCAGKRGQNGGDVCGKSG